MSDKATVTEAANRYGIDPKVLWGLYGTETSFGKDLSTSSAGAVGPFQFLPSTARSMGVNPNDFKSAAFGAARYLAQYKGRGIGGMLSAYNAGPAGGYQSGYVSKTLANARSYGSAPGKVTSGASGTAIGLPGAPSRQVTEPDTEGLQRAKGLAQLARLIKSEGGLSSNPLLTSGLLSTKEPEASEYTKQRTIPGTPAQNEVVPPPGKTLAYVNPISSGFTRGRTDMGVDASATPGAPIRAMGNARILGISPNWYKGQPYLYYELLDGPERGKVVYVAEQIAPTVHTGQTVRAGEMIARYAPSGTGIETGFGTRTGGRTLAQATTGYTEGQETAAGKAFKRLLEGAR